MALRKNCALLAALLLIVAFLVVGNRAPGQVSPQVVQYPDPDIGVNSLAARKQAQAKTVNQFKVYHDFRFTDKLKESGITFIHHTVDGVSKHFVPSHYDHGTGIAVADVDGDGLPDIYFVNQVGGSELWKNLGNGKFTNITKEAGVGLEDRIAVTASFADIDNDGDQDLFVTTTRGGNVLFENDGHGHFKDISKQAGLDLVAHSAGAVFFDYDNDGLLDLFVCNIGKFTTEQKGPDGTYIAFANAFSGHLFPERFEKSILYKNMGGNRFKDVSEETGLVNKAWSGDASFSDLNGDGRPDLYVLNMQGDNHYYENVGGRHFAEKTAQYFPKTPWGAMGIKFFDFDNDGRIDLLLTDMHSDMSHQIGPESEKQKSEMKWSHAALGGGYNSIFGNALYRNLGAGKFEEVSDRLGVENYWPWGPSVGDINADGWDDIFIAASMSYPFRYGINSMLLNNQGEKFLDSEFLLGIEPRRDGRTHTPWFELDCSGEDRNSAHCKDRAGKIVVAGTIGTRSAVMFDLDNDGDLDIVTNDFGTVPQVLVSDLAQRKAIHWVKIVLTGTASNRNGLGATVRVHAGGHVYMKYNDGKSGYLSQSVLPLYFGLGDAQKVDRVEVDWPSGRKQALTQDVHANETLTVTEPK
jgi:enediyne biosynthesis protein E4